MNIYFDSCSLYQRLSNNFLLSAGSVSMKTVPLLVIDKMSLTPAQVRDSTGVNLLLIFSMLPTNHVESQLAVERELTN